MPRPGEKEGRDYFFVSEEEFARKKQEKRFLEWAQVHGYYYGTPREFVQKNLLMGKDVLLEIDVQGAMKIKKIYPDALLIFVLPPSFKVLKERLLVRKKDSPGQIEKRLEQAKKELKQVEKYEYAIINDKLEKAAKELRTIVLAERLKISRLTGERKKVVHNLVGDKW